MKFATTALLKAFKNCYVPSEFVLKEKFKKHFNCDINILEKDNEHLTIQLLFGESKPTYYFLIGKIKDKDLIVDIREITK